MIGSDYELHEVLGSGAYGRVWRATDKHGRVHAVKFFTGGSAKDRERFVIAHATPLMRVHSLGVVRITAIARLPNPDTGAEELAIVMEYLSGIDLLHFTGTISLERARSCVATLAAGLEAIHEAGLVHNDVHSGNALLTDTSAKWLDIPYEKSLADTGASAQVRTRVEDVHDFVRVVRDLFEKVPSLDRNLLKECHYQAERRATTPAQVLAEFSRLWPSASNHDERLGQLEGAARLYLVLQRGLPDQFYTTYVVANGRPVAYVPGFLVAARERLLALEDPGRDISILREDFLERWRDSSDDPKPSDYKRKVLSAPRLADAYSVRLERSFRQDLSGRSGLLERDRSEATGEWGQAGRG